MSFNKSVGRPLSRQRYWCVSISLIRKSVTNCSSSGTHVPNPMLHYKVLSYHLLHYHTCILGTSNLYKCMFAQKCWLVCCSLHSLHNIVLIYRYNWTNKPWPSGNYLRCTHACRLLIPPSNTIRPCTKSLYYDVRISEDFWGQSWAKNSILICKSLSSPLVWALWQIRLVD